MQYAALFFNCKVERSKLIKLTEWQQIPYKVFAVTKLHKQSLIPGSAPENQDRTMQSAQPSL